MNIAASNDKQTLVGRYAEVAAIDKALDALAPGSGRVMFFAGEPGIGKSTLARRTAAKAAAKNVPAYWGFAWEAGGAPAYWPWTQLLRSLVKDQAIGEDQLSGLSQLLPESARGEASGLDPEQMRFQLLESVRLLFESLSERKPFVLLLEDLHAADADTLVLLQYLARHAATLGILIVGTYRSIEARTMPEAEVLMRASRDADVYELQPLSESEVREYLEPRKSDDQAQDLLKTTGGNPLFLVELVQVLESGGDASRLPATVQQVIDQQIRLLPEATVGLLGQASIQGRTFNIDELAGYSSKSLADIAGLLEPAIETGLIRSFDKGSYRFAHALHRDVVYGGLPANERSLMHLTYAERIREDIDNGNEDRWSEVALHLESAGTEHSKAAVNAWRSAASRAQGRLAFDEAAQQLAHALETFGTGPRFDPHVRFELQLDCAEATILAGHTEAGQQYCRDAFALARTLEDAELMSQAALTWGSVFVVARIDKDLIAALQECVEHREKVSVATHAKLMARLAAALQPAEDPTEPMTMARDAIELARTTNDDETVHQVLRSAISALMDFAPARERIPLNQEFAELATRLGDVPGRFRSNLRLMADACEAGDSDLLRNAIDSIESLARRIGLPHYLWRAASASAMLATIEGRFERAAQLLDVAEREAAKIVDCEAEIVLPIQRFALLTEWDNDQPSTLETIKRQLKSTFDSCTPDAEFFIAPFVRAHTTGNDAGVARELIADRNMVERVFAFRDRFSFCITAEIALMAGDLKLAERILDACLVYEDDCASLGLIGNVWLGPIANTLGNISAALGRADEAADYYQRALESCEAMRAQPGIARVHGALARLEQSRGNDDKAIEHRQIAERMRAKIELREFRVAPEGLLASVPTSTVTALSLTQSGDIWEVTYAGNSVSVRDSKGMRMLSRLVDAPGKEIHVLDLSGAGVSVESGDSGPILDDKARAQYQKRISELHEELEEAEEFADVGRADGLRDELDALTRELSGAFGLGGRARKAGSDAERARVNVRRRIKDAIDRISEQNSSAGRFLQNTIKTGVYCKYAPM